MFWKGIYTRLSKKHHSQRRKNVNQDGKKRKPAEIKMSTVSTKVDQYTESDSPLVQREMARRAKVSQPHVCRIIRKKLDKKRTKKKTVKRLSAAMIAKRKERAKPFSESASVEKVKCILTLDEAMLPLNFLSGQSSHFYQSKKIRKKWKAAGSNLPVRLCSQPDFLGEDRASCTIFPKNPR